MASGWLSLLRSLAEALIDVLRAEAEALRSDLRASGRGLGLALVLAAVAMFLLFWAFGAGALIAYQVLLLFLPGWGAAAAVFGILLIAGLGVALAARSRWRGLESPAATAARRWRDHQEWWRQQLVASSPESATRSALEEEARSDA